MARRIFISYQHDDQMKAKGFNLLRWNKYVDVEFRWPPSPQSRRQHQ